MAHKLKTYRVHRYSRGSGLSDSLFMSFPQGPRLYVPNHRTTSKLRPGMIPVYHPEPVAQALAPRVGVMSKETKGGHASAQKKTRAQALAEINKALSK